MKKIILHYGFIVPLLAFLIHQLLQGFTEVRLYAIDNFIDPFCLGALGLHVIAVERHLFFDERLSILDVILTIIILAVVTEFLFPIFSNDFVFDWFDLLAITLGACWFILTRKALIKAPISV